MAFNPKGKGYDYKSAKKAGMKPTIDPKDGKLHWGSVAPATKKEQATGNLPKGSYKVLKGEKHETMWKAKDAEEKRGARLVKRGGKAQNSADSVRTYSIPTIHMGGEQKDDVLPKYNKGQ
jgi:hypothetical protein